MTWGDLLGGLIGGGVAGATTILGVVIVIGRFKSKALARGQARAAR